MKKLIYSTLICITFLSVSCSTVPFTGRSQLSLVDDASLRQEAKLSYTQFLKDPKTKVVTSGEQAAVLVYQER